MRQVWGAVLLLFCSVVVYGQSPDTAALRGRVTGPNGILPAGTHVIIEDAQHRVVRDLPTAANGEFVAEGLAPESVTVRAEAPGLEAGSGTLNLAAGTMATVSLELQVPTVHAE